MVRALVLCLALCACGARSGVDLDDAAVRDAGTPPGFDTFPCRWSLTRPTLVGEPRSAPTALHGGVHGLRDEALVLADAPFERTGAVLALGDPSTIVARVELESDAVLGHRDGWLALRGCERFESRSGTRFDFVTRYGDHTSCFLEPNVPSHLDLTLLAPGLVTLISEHVVTGTMRRVDIAHAGSGTARAVRLQSLGWIVLTETAAGLRGYRVTEEGEVSGPFDLAPQNEPFAVALDRVRPAALILRRDPEGLWRLERVPFADDLRLLPIADLSGLEPFGTLVSNETEALLPLRDGRVAVVPVDGSALRFIGPVPEAPVSEMAVILRPGSSGGGLLYAHENRLTFRALTCNR